MMLQCPSSGDKKRELNKKHVFHRKVKSNIKKENEQKLFLLRRVLPLLDTSLITLKIFWCLKMLIIPFSAISGPCDSPIALIGTKIQTFA